MVTVPVVVAVEVSVTVIAAVTVSVEVSVAVIVSVSVVVAVAVTVVVAVTVAVVVSVVVAVAVTVVVAVTVAVVVSVVVAVAVVVAVRVAVVVTVVVGYTGSNVTTYAWPDFELENAAMDPSAVSDAELQPSSSISTLGSVPQVVPPSPLSHAYLKPLDCKLQQTNILEPSSDTAAELHVYWPVLPSWTSVHVAPMNKDLNHAIGRQGDGTILGSPMWGRGLHPGRARIRAGVNASIRI